MKKKNTTQQPLKRKWTGPIDKRRQFNSAYLWIYRVKLILKMNWFSTAQLKAMFSLHKLKIFFNVLLLREQKW